MVIIELTIKIFHLRDLLTGYNLATYKWLENLTLRGLYVIKALSKYQLCL